MCYFYWQLYIADIKSNIKDSNASLNGEIEGIVPGPVIIIIHNNDRKIVHEINFDLFLNRRHQRNSLIVVVIWLRCRRHHRNCGQIKSQKKNAKRDPPRITAHRHTAGSQFNFNYLLIKVPENHRRMRYGMLEHSILRMRIQLHRDHRPWVRCLVKCGRRARACMNLFMRTHRTHHLIWWMGNYSDGIPHRTQYGGSTLNTDGKLHQKWKNKCKWKWFAILDLR